MSGNILGVSKVLAENFQPELNVKVSSAGEFVQPTDISSGFSLQLNSRNTSSEASGTIPHILSAFFL